jgi:hypothetical protein
VVSAERFWAKVEKTDGCWLWQGTKTTFGYGVFSGRPAHRVAYALTHGPIPDGLCVRHSCDNPPCVNPAHLSVGTLADNRADCVARNRQAKGSVNGRAKLTERDVQLVRAFYAEGVLTVTELSLMFGVSRRAIRLALDGKKWKHVPPIDGFDRFNPAIRAELLERINHFRTR